VPLVLTTPTASRNRRQSSQRQEIEAFRNPLCPPLAPCSPCGRVPLVPSPEVPPPCPCVDDADCGSILTKFASRNAEADQLTHGNNLPAGSRDLYAEILQCCGDMKRGSRIGLARVDLGFFFRLQFRHVLGGVPKKAVNFSQPLGISIPRGQACGDCLYGNFWLLCGAQSPVLILSLNAKTSTPRIVNKERGNLVLEPGRVHMVLKGLSKLSQPSRD
jgi:hypothetical protein